MDKNPFLILLLICFTLSITDTLNGDDKSLGIFQQNRDIGQPELSGSAEYLESEDAYKIRGAGENMWFDSDECHFVYKKMTGDFTVTARPDFIGEGVNPHRKLGWMIRASMDSSAAYVDVAVHGDGLTSMQYRPEHGADTGEIQSEMIAPAIIQLQRKGETYIMSVGHAMDSLTDEILSGIELGDEVYVGLFVCSHDAGVIEEAIFKEVQIDENSAVR